MRRPLAFAAAALTLGVLAAPAADTKGRRLPEPAAVFRLRPDWPRHVTCDVEFRDPADVLWPTFFYGKPAAAGTFTFDPVEPQAAFRVTCNHRAQKHGDQSRRVLGELLGGDPGPVVTFEVKALGA